MASREAQRRSRGRGYALLVLNSLLPLALGLPAGARAGEAIEIGSRRELFVDDLLVERLEGARLELHHPTPRERVFTLDRSWEGKFSGYFTVLRDRGRFRMYYRGLPEARHSLQTEVTCLAESEDGVHWTRPNLRLFEVRGSRENNVVLAHHRACHNFAPFVDTNPKARPGERYKAFGGTGRPGLLALVSADGVHWRDLRPEPVITEGAFDSQNVGFWSAAEGKYVAYFRVFHQGVRWIARSTSEDFVLWAKPRVLRVQDGPLQHLYTNQIIPCPRAPHIYIGTPTRFFPGRRALSRETLESIGTSTEKWDFRNDCADIVLVSSRGGDELRRRYLEAFVRPGRDPRNWTSRANYAARGIFPAGEGELTFWVNHHVGYPSSHLRRYTLRVDGFASVSAPFSGGELLTRPLHFRGSRLEINASTSAAGGIRVEIQDSSGAPRPGFRLEECEEIIGDEIARVVRWKGESDVSRLSPEPIRLRFVLCDADLYSLRFAP